MQQTLVLQNLTCFVTILWCYSLLICSVLHQQTPFPHSFLLLLKEFLSLRQGKNVQIPTHEKNVNPNLSFSVILTLETGSAQHFYLNSTIQGYSVDQKKTQVSH